MWDQERWARRGGSEEVGGVQQKVGPKTNATREHMKTLGNDRNLGRIDVGLIRGAVPFLCGGSVIYIPNPEIT